MIARFLLLFAFLFAVPAFAQAPAYPPLTGRVVDNADLLDPGQEAELTARLEALQTASTRQLVVVTLPDLGGRTIEEYGLGLGRTWGIGQGGSVNNGVLLIVAVQERKVRIEVGYGLEGIMTDALSGRIIRDRITPRFREGDYPGGINAGVDAIIQQLQAPPEAAEQRALEAAQAERDGGGGGSVLVLIFWVIVIAFIVIAAIARRGVRGRRYGKRRGWAAPVVIWGDALDRTSHWGSSGGGSSWGGGGGGWSGGGGGFSGGGGSFGGGGASGGW